MLDSPYVRRVAISLQLLDLPFEHRSLSVFSTFAQFQEINPVVKAPSLICNDGEVLIDSTLILEFAEALAVPRKSLMPAGLAERQHALCVIGLALAACEKSVQIVYERKMHGSSASTCCPRSSRQKTTRSCASSPPEPKRCLSSPQHRTAPAPTAQRTERAHIQVNA